MQIQCESVPVRVLFMNLHVTGCQPPLLPSADLIQVEVTHFFFIINIISSEALISSRTYSTLTRYIIQFIRPVLRLIFVSYLEHVCFGTRAWGTRGVHPSKKYIIILYLEATRPRVRYVCARTDRCTSINFYKV